MRRGIGIGLAWLSATAVALVAASTAVSVVAEQVSGDLPPPLPAAYLPGTPTPPEAATATDEASEQQTPGTRPGASASPDDATVADPGAPPRSSEPSLPGTASPTTPAPSDAATPDTTPTTSSETRTVHAVGGATTLRFAGGTVTVVWATPNDGFSATVEGSGTAEAKVEFRSEHHRSRIKADHEDGQPDIEVEEREEDHEDEEEDEDGD